MLSHTHTAQLAPHTPHVVTPPPPNNSQEEETRDRENQKFKRLLSEAREAENNRNRDRVVEIRMLIEAHEATLNEATEELFGDDGY